ncbi:hypothetical protein [Actinacidiphila glaucinigra]|uniref:hypothetical protein n=1 Tax=Actinacidiphila glaucinigra TaxID=235986 RepID=UPI003D940D12
MVDVLVVAAMIYDTARLIATGESRCPPLSRLRGHRAALEAAERWCTGLRLHGRIDAATYQHRMSAGAHGHRCGASTGEEALRTYPQGRAG